MDRKQSKANQAQAIAEGRKTYQGAICKRGHDGLRWVSNGACDGCQTHHNRAWTKADREADNAYSRTLREANREAHNASNRTWYKSNKEGANASSRAYNKTYRLSPWNRARILLTNARNREIAKGIPDDQQLDIELWRPAVAAELEVSPWDFDLTKKRKSGHELGPSISRLDHGNPCYTDNFVIEPLYVNMARGTKTNKFSENALTYALAHCKHLIEYEPLQA